MKDLKTLKEILASSGLAKAFLPREVVESSKAVEPQDCCTLSCYFLAKADCCTKACIALAM